MEIFLVCTFLSYWSLTKALFTVEVAKSDYVTQYGGTVNMTCTFPVADSLRMKDVKVYWHKKSALQTAEKEIYVLDGGKENLTLQDVGYRGRATLLKDELYQGQAVLQITNVKLTDAGTYRCLIIYGAADHEHVTLQVKASFRKISKFKKIISVSGQEETELMCQSEGSPKAEVFWQNEGRDLSDQANTSYKIKDEQLYDMTTVLRVSETVNTTYRCIFWNKELQENISESFSFSEKLDLPRTREQKAYYGTMLVGSVLVVLAVTLLIWMQRNGHCIKLATVRKERKDTVDRFAYKRNPSSHIWKLIRNICPRLSHRKDKRLPIEDHDVKRPVCTELKILYLAQLLTAEMIFVSTQMTCNTLASAESSLSALRYQGNPYLSRIFDICAIWRKKAIL